MKPELRVGIIGGGAAGLYLGSKLAKEGVDVKVYEEHPHIGVPDHCAGLISPPTLSISGVTSRVVRAELRGVKIGIPNKIEVVHTGETMRAVVIDREKFDMELARRLSAYGGEISLSSEASVEREGGRVFVGRRGRREEFDFVVDSGGSKSYLRRVGDNAGVLPALQMDVASSDHDPGIAEIWVDKTKNTDLFFWCIPIEKDTVRIGTASRHTRLAETLTEFAAWRFGEIVEMGRLPGLVLLSGHIDRFVEGKVLYVGDAAGQTKPTTGGGLRYGLSGASEAAEAILGNFKGEKPLTSYEENWMGRWGREVSVQRLARKIFLSLDEKTMLKLLRLVKEENLLPLLVERGDMDGHSSLISLLVKNRKILQFGLRVLGGMLREMIYIDE